MRAGRNAGVFALVLVAALWGVSFPLVEVAVAGKTHGQMLLFLFLRFALASILLLPFVGALRRTSAGKGLRPWMFGFSLSVLFFVGFYLQTWGLRHTDASRSAFVTVLNVPMVPFLAAFVGRRAPSRVHVIGSLVAIFGIALVLAPGGTLAPNRGDWLTLGSAIVFAVEIVVLAYATRRAPFLILVFGQIVGVALIAGLVLPFADLELPAEWPGLVPGIVVTGIFCTALALAGMTWGQARVSPEVAAVIFALEPVFAVLFVWFLAGEGLGPLQAVGGVIVLVAVVCTARVSVGSRT